MSKEHYLYEIELPITATPKVVTIAGKTMKDAVLDAVKSHHLGDSVLKIKTNEINAANRMQVVRAWSAGGQGEKFKLYIGRYAPVYSYLIIKTEE